MTFSSSGGVGPVTGPAREPRGADWCMHALPVVPGSLRVGGQAWCGRGQAHRERSGRWACLPRGWVCRPPSRATAPSSGGSWKRPRGRGILGGRGPRCHPRTSLAGCPSPRTSHVAVAPVRWGTAAALARLAAGGRDLALQRQRQRQAEAEAEAAAEHRKAQRQRHRVCGQRHARPAGFRVYFLPCNRRHARSTSLGAAG